jgi:mono/diheme cytochrome c family protein
MRKILVMAAFLSVALTAIYFSSCSNNNTDQKSEASKEDSVKKVLDRGAYLVNHVAGCIDCHSKRDFTKFSGPVVHGTEGGGGMVFDQKFGLPGVLYGKNITPDTATGIGSWTDAELLRAMTQGINKNGDTLFPLMPYPQFNRMAKEDLLSIIAYIRTLKPINHAVPARQLMIPIGAVYPAPILQASIDGNTKPDESDQVKYGEYLVNMADCGTCHSPLTPQGPDMTRMFAGGYVFDLGTNKVVSANITPDSLTGIGAWNEAMFLDKFTRYRNPNSFNVDSGTRNTIMPLSIFSGIKDEDLKAMYAYLRSLKPIANKVDKFPQ